MYRIVSCSFVFPIAGGGVYLRLCRSSRRHRVYHASWPYRDELGQEDEVSMPEITTREKWLVARKDPLTRAEELTLSRGRSAGLG